MVKNTHHQIAELELSGEPIKVGVYSHDTGESIYFKTEEHAEPIYISIAEANLFIAALRAAKDRIKSESV